MSPVSPIARLFAEAESEELAGFDDVDELELDRELVRKGGLKAFVELAWSEVEPGEFVDGWHIDEICTHLEAVSDGRIKRLIINVPPGTMKSLLVCVFFHAWDWIEHPSRKWIFASYSAGLSRRDAVRARNLIDSPWFQARWPDVAIPFQNTRSATDFMNNRGGFRFSTSVAGPVTGRHADIQVVDDPIKPLDVEGGAEATRTKINQCFGWWRGTMSSRMANPKTAARIIIMQRLHESDLAGAMLKEAIAGGEAYVHLRLPMEYEAAEPCETAIGGDRRTNEGELLWPGRFPEDEVKLLKQAMGPRVAAAQLQQRPTPAGGTIFLQEYFQHWGHEGSLFEKLPPMHEMRLVQSWDCSFKDLKTSDYVVGQVWGFWQAHAFLLDQVRGQWSFTETCKRLEMLSTKWPKAWVKMVEDKANGTAVVNVLGPKVVGLKLVNPEGGKEARANAVEPVWAGGNVWLPHPSISPWVEAFEHECKNFPAGSYDDQVDAMTQALLPFAQGNRLETLRRAMEAAMGKRQAS